MDQKVTGFHLDEENHWVADLECGHKQHVRHDPPWVERPWVISEEGRKSRLGMILNCKRCDECGLKVASAVREACIEAVDQLLEEHEWANPEMKNRMIEVKDRIEGLELKPLIRSSLAAPE